MVRGPDGEAKLPTWTALANAQRNLGLTRVEFARELKLARPTLINLEQGLYRGKPATLYKIAQYFGLTVAELEATRVPGGVIQPRKPSIQRRMNSTA